MRLLMANQQKERKLMLVLVGEDIQRTRQRNLKCQSFGIFLKTILMIYLVLN
ncbi:UNVERIFIED_CONTAM: hypothetical protein FKN15_066171 [Acipenser sinensis]